MKKRIIQAVAKDNQRIHTFRANKKTMALLEQLQEHYSSITLMECNNNLIYIPIKKLFVKSN